MVEPMVKTPGVEVEITELANRYRSTHIVQVKRFVKVGGDGGDVEELIAMLKAAGYEERR